VRAGTSSRTKISSVREPHRLVLCLQQARSMGGRVLTYKCDSMYGARRGGGHVKFTMIEGL
jgi:hypothetical protein